jgi:putative membrane protein
MEHYLNFKYIAASIVYSFIGIIILFFSFWLIEKVTPENLYKEILENKNVALAIILSAFMLAIAIIIASAIHG